MMLRLLFTLFLCATLSAGPVTKKAHTEINKEFLALCSELFAFYEEAEEKILSNEELIQKFTKANAAVYIGLNFLKNGDSLEETIEEEQAYELMFIDFLKEHVDEQKELLTTIDASFLLDQTACEHFVEQLERNLWDLVDIIASGLSDDLPDPMKAKELYQKLVPLLLRSQDLLLLLNQIEMTTKRVIFLTDVNEIEPTLNSLKKSGNLAVAVALYTSQNKSSLPYGWNSTSRGVFTHPSLFPSATLFATFPKDFSSSLHVNSPFTKKAHAWIEEAIFSKG